MTGNEQRPDARRACDGDHDRNQEDYDPRNQSLLPEGTIARRIVDRLRNPWVIAILIIIFVPMVAWVGYTVYSDLTSPDYWTAIIYDEDGDYLKPVKGSVTIT